MGEGKSSHFLDRRQRRIDRRRGEILSAAARVFAEKGYANTTTRVIAEAADIAEGTLYNYFPSKREILLAIANETQAPMEEAVMGAGDIRDRGELVALVERALDIPPSQLAFMRTILAEAWVDDYILEEFAAIRLKRIHHRLTGFIAERVANGAFRPVDPALTAQMVMGMFIAAILPILRGVREPQDAEQRRGLAEAIVSLLLDGVLASRG